MKRVLFVGALLLAVGIGIALGPSIGFADADDSTTTTQPFYGRMANTGFADWQGERMGRGMMGGGFGFALAGTSHEGIAEALGITSDELFELTQAGKSLAEIAEEKGVSVEQLTEVIVSAHIEQLDQLVADGKLTEENKALLLENVEEMAIAMINGTMPVDGRGFGGKGFRGMGGGIGFGFGPQLAGTNHTEIAEFLGLTADELTEQIVAGKSLAEIAEDKGISEEQLIVKLTEIYKTKLDQLVTDGSITEDQKATFLENIDAKINDMITAKKSDFQKGNFHDKKGRGFMPNSSFQGGRGYGTYTADTSL